MAILGYRKRAMAEVWISNGNGEIVVNDVPFIEYFCKQEDRCVKNSLARECV